VCKIVKVVLVGKAPEDVFSVLRLHDCQALTLFQKMNPQLEMKVFVAKLHLKTNNIRILYLYVYIF
jgi:hypothetical protein